MSGRLPSSFTGDEDDFVDSDYVFCLGDHSLRGRYPLNAGDGVSVEQEHDFSKAAPLPNLIRIGARMRNPAFTPAGYAWRFSLWLDGSMQVSRLFRLPDRNLVDMAIAMPDPSSGLHTVKFQLDLVAV